LSEKVISVLLLLLLLLLLLVVVVVVVVVVVLLVITCMQGIYNFIHKTNKVSRIFYSYTLRYV
jgi:hypothetical protein